MKTFTYRAMTQTGELVVGTIDAPDRGEVVQRIEYLGILPIEITLNGDVNAGISPAAAAFSWKELLSQKPTHEDITRFSRDLALVLKAGAPIDVALQLLLSDTGNVRMPGIIRAMIGAVTAGESFAAALGQHPKLFFGMYIALVKVGEASGSLPQVLEALGDERSRTEVLRNKVTDALRYPAFVLFTAAMVMTFFLVFVFPQFATILRDFGAKLDPLVTMLLWVSDFVVAHSRALLAGIAVLIFAIVMIWRNASSRRQIKRGFFRLPIIRGAAECYHTARFCRALNLLVSNGVPLNRALKLLSAVMDDSGASPQYNLAEEKLRQGNRLADALAETELPALAVNMIRLGEETSQVAMLSGKVAELYEQKLERTLDRIVGIIGPAAILLIATVVGGLIVSIMTSLLSINEVIQ